MRKILITIFIVSLFSMAYAGTLSRNDVDEVVIDTTNNLMWQDNEASGDGVNNTTWANAISICENLDMAGHTDWRLPNINELRSTIDYSEPLYTYAVFENVNVGGQYWSSTTMQDAFSPDNAWTIIIWLNGSSFSGDKASDNLDIRCVRSTD